MSYHRDSRPLVIAITGGIGSGKSTAVNLFVNLGAQAVSTDSIAADLVAKDTPALNQICHQFGDRILTPEGELDRTKLRHRVFADDEQRQWLETLLHPLILKETRQRLKHPSEADYLLLEIPLLRPGSDYLELADRILVVDVPEDVQATRAARRDQSTEEAIHAIIRAQPSRAERLALADDVIDNSGTPEALEKQVYSLHEQYRELAGRT